MQFHGTFTVYIVLLGSCIADKDLKSKRILVNDPDFILKELNNLKTELTDVKNSNAILKAKTDTLTTSNAALRTEVEGLKQSNNALQNTVAHLQSSDGGSIVYTRWGKRSCYGNMTELVYTGYTGGSWYNHPGGASNYICLTSDPLWGNYNDTVDSYRGRVYGAEYENLQFNHNVYGNTEDAPCSVCRSRNAKTVLMIPGRNTCYSGWNIEYHGYLMSDYYNHNSPTEYICLDANPDLIAGGHMNKDGASIFSVEGICGSLPCPPYVNGRELTCVVCSK